MEANEEPRPVLLVSDLDATLAFYGDRLGFEVQRMGEDEFGSASREQATILFALVEDYDAVLADPAAEGGGARVHVQVDDVNALLAEVEGRGATLSHPLSSDGGFLVFVTRDPDGHEIAFMQPAR